MSFINREDVAYCAGLYEGEGSIYCNMRSDKTNCVIRGLQLSISMTNIEPLWRFQEWMDVGRIYGPYSRKDDVVGKPLYNYSVNRFEDTQYVITAIWNWLSPKKQEQAIKALNKYHSFKPIYSMKDK